MFLMLQGALTSGFIKDLAMLDLQTEATSAQKSALFLLKSILITFLYKQYRNNYFLGFICRYYKSIIIDISAKKWCYFHHI